MGDYLRVFAGCAAVVLLMLSSACGTSDAPSASATALPASAATAASAKVLDPSHPEVNLLKEGLKIAWRQDLEQVTKSRGLRQIYVAGNALLAETPDGSLFHFSADRGVWTGSTRLKGTLWAPPAAADGKIFALTTRGVVGMSAATGELQTQANPRFPATAKPLPFDGSLILGGGNGKVLRIGTEKWEHQWIVSAGGAVNVQPVADKDTVYAAGYKGELIAVDAAKGVVRWSWEPKRPSELVSGVALDKGLLYAGDDRGFLYCVSAPDGVVLWKYPAGAPIGDTPVPVGGGRLLVFTYKGDALCLSLGNEPKVVWKLADAASLIATGKTCLYILTRDSAVACVECDTGKELWRLPVAAGCLMASDPSRPMFYLASPGGKIAAVAELD